MQAIHGPMSQSVLEEAKAHFQEQLLRKAAQRQADAAMDEEQKRWGDRELQLDIINEVVILKN